jgi:hypothetical protein
MQKITSNLNFTQNHLKFYFNWMCFQIWTKVGPHRNSGCFCSFGTGQNSRPQLRFFRRFRVSRGTFQRRHLRHRVRHGCATFIPNIFPIVGPLYETSKSKPSLLFHSAGVRVTQEASGAGRHGGRLVLLPGKHHSRPARLGPQRLATHFVGHQRAGTALCLLHLVDQTITFTQSIDICRHAYRSIDSLTEWLCVYANTNIMLKKQVF